MPGDHVVSYPQQQGLLNALGERRLLLVVGPLVREAAGLVGMWGLTLAALAEPEFGETERADIRTAAAAGKFADAFEAIKFRLGPRFAAVFEPLLAGPKVAPPASLRALAGLAEQLSLVLTTNLDSLIETTLSGAWIPLAGATADLASRTRTVFKLLGTAHVVSSWKFTADGLQNATYRQAHVRQEVAAVLRSHQLLLVGFRGDDELLDQLVRMREHAPEDPNAPEWVALVPPGTPEITRQALGRRGVALVTLDVPVGDVAAYDAVVAAHLRSLARAAPPVSRAVSAPEPMLTGNPYPGLAPFVEAQAGQFFGRADSCAELLGKLGRRGTAHVRWLALTGPSGVGKSSLMAAGLVPALRAGEPSLPDAPTKWAVAQLRPGREALRNLAEAVRDALARDLGVVTAPESLTRDKLLHDRSLADFLASRLQGAGLLVVLDQFEEAFTFGAAEDRPYLDALLVRSLQDIEVPFYLITAIRSDCTSELGQHFPRLAEQQNLGTLCARYDLAPLRPHELREAIERPAELAGQVFEPMLVERILHDAGAVHTSADDVAPDAALPLVAHVLHALHEQAVSRILTLRAYEALGGVVESLTRSADRLLAELSGQFAESQIRDLLVALVELHPQGRDTRRVLPWAAALTAAGGGDEADTSARANAESLLRRLSGGAVRPGEAPDVRLLATRGEGEHAVVDLVHDALLREWSTLRGWLQEDRAAGLLRMELERAADGWSARGQRDDELWRGGRLAYAITLNGNLLPLSVRSFLMAAEKLARDEEAIRVEQHTQKLRAAEALAAAAELAETRLKAANKVVEGILFDVLPKLADIPGTATVRKLIHRELETLQLTLLTVASDNASSQRNRMVQHWDRGKVALTHDDLGLTRREFEEALRIAEALLERDPDRPRAQHDISVSLIMMGDVEVQAGNLVGARLLFARALEVLEALEEADPSSVLFQRDLSVSLDRLGDVEVQAGNLPGARAQFIRSLGIREALAKNDLSSTQTQRDISIVLSKLGDVEVQAGNLAGARARFSRSLAIDEKLAEADPPSVQAQRDLSIVLDRLGDVEMQTGNLTGARAYFVRSLAVREMLTKAEPDSAQTRRDISVSCERLGDVEIQAGNLSGARTQFVRALAVAEALAKADPSNAQAQRDLSISRERLGDLEMQAGNLAVARAQFVQSMNVREDLAKADSGNALACRDYAISMERLGEVETQSGNLACARAQLIHSLTIRAALAKHDPSSALMQHELSICLSKLGELEMQAGNLAEARTQFMHSLVVAESLAKAEPSSATAQRNLSIVLIKLGDVELRTGNVADARTQFERSLAVREVLAKADPDSALAQRDLSISLNRVGNVEMRAGNLARARTVLERSLAVTEELARADPTNSESLFDRVLSRMKHYALARAEKNITEMREQLTAVKALLDVMESSGQLTGYAQREKVRGYVSDRLAEFK